PTIEVDSEFALLHVDGRHDAEIAVVDVLVVVILDLHDLVARAEGPAEAVDANLAGRVQRVLQLDVEGTSAKTAALHRAEHMDIANGIEPETLRNALLHDRQQLPYSLFRVRSVDEIEVAAFDMGEVRQQALIDAMSIDDDPALGGLSENFSQAHNRHG